MKTTFCILALLAACACSLKSASPGRRGADDEHALNSYPSVEDRLRILSHSLLQLGSGLKEQVERTKEQMGRISQQLELFNSSLAELVLQVGACRSSGDSLGRRAQELARQDAQLQRLAAELQGRLHRALEHGAAFEGKLRALEERTENSLDIGAGGSLVILLRMQSRRIDELFAEVELQHSAMSAQEAEIEYLIRKTGSRRRKSGRQN